MYSTDQQGTRTEAVAIFEDAETFQAAIDEILSSGFDRAELNLLASEQAVEENHLEVVYDLDTEAQAVCREAGMAMVRAKTVGIHPSFVRMVRELVEERLSGTAERPFLGVLGSSPDDCPDNCCLASG